MRNEIIILLIVGALLITTPKASAKTTPGTYIPRGLKNNNPGNLKISGNDWRGRVPLSQNTDGVFEQFYEVEMGIRAAILTLRSYFEKGINTIAGIVSRWAPMSENNTNAYIDYVEKCSGLNRLKTLSFEPVNISNILHCMFVLENGEKYKNLVPTPQKIRQVWAIYI